MFPSASFLTAPPSVTPKWSVVTPPAANALDLIDVKTFLNRPIEDTFWDGELSRFAQIAVNALETSLRITLVETTFVGKLPYLYPQMRIDRRPFQEVSKIEIVQPDGQIVEVPTSIYHALPISQECGMLFLADGATWPDIAKRWDAVRITVKAGWPVGELPDDLQHAVLMTIAAIDSKRGDQKETGGSDITVYAMKAAKGSSLIPVEARALVDNWKMQVLTVA